MKKTLANIALIASTISLAACMGEGIGPGYGASPGTGSQGAPPSVAPAELYDLGIDGDRLRPSVSHGNGSRVRVCIRNATKWNKGIGLVGRQWFQADPNGTSCVNNVAAGPGQRFALWKAKFAGVMTNMGARELDLTGHEGNTVTYTWTGK
ncbi:MAG: hypothetical protein V3V15_10760 [Sphingorhabdus sp.]